MRRQHKHSSESRQKIEGTCKSSRSSNQDTLKSLTKNWNGIFLSGCLTLMDMMFSATYKFEQNNKQQRRLFPRKLQLMFPLFLNYN